jgi:holo-[acyl-carrier protein] synthase
MIVGIGTDVVGVPRFAAILMRTPGFAERVFTDAERVSASGGTRSPVSLAARFAAKEAAAKALGVPRAAQFRDCEVVVDGTGRPSLRVTGALGDAAEQLGVTAWHVSLTHDADLAAAIVVAEG